ncbi:WbaZ-like glycosyltransferase [Botrimarina colliarenosi]|uniref:WbaZ-like glycosyltransferase n=1 Tax=Botrimarina colliarenosi TaxID=2528001 RepID=A0A5C6AFK6_9BACT|nr:glycosyltransferase [Botrimarina colliarenosi]TWT97975.1 WbaZ-like glycosyltransferase [Botrimarina colliarenosi]
MTSVFLAAIAAGVVSLLLTRYSITLSHRWRLLDHPDPRKVHQKSTPRLGGVGIIGAALLVGIPAFAYLANTHTDAGWIQVKHYAALTVGAIFVFGMGVLDDLWQVSSKLKLLTLLAASFVFSASGAGLHELVYDFEAFISFPWLSWILTACWITGMAVAFNFIDGLDGLAGGLALMAFGVLAYFQLDAHNYAPAVAPMVMVGAIAGFLYYNHSPARTFMGDGGSLTLGYLIGAMTIAANDEPQLGTMRAMVIPSLAMSVAIVDSALTMFRRRYQQRRSMFTAERGHIHHRLLDRGIQPHHVTLLIHAFSAAAVAVGCFSLGFDGWHTLGGLALVAPLIWALFHAAGSMRTTEMVSAIRKKRAIDRTSRRHRSSFEALQLEFDSASTFREWWETVCNAAERLHFARLVLPIAPAEGTDERTFTWVNADIDLGGEGLHLDANLPIEIAGGRSTIAEVRIPIAESLESAGERLALFSRLMADNGRYALRRVTRQDASVKPVSPTLPVGEFGGLRVAVVHDFFYTYAGAERVVEQIIRVLPQCDVFGLFDFLPEEDRGFLHGKPVRTTFLQHLPFARSKHRAYLPLMPLAIEQLDVSGYDLVVSSSYLAAKGVITGPDQVHVCYCHSPVRYGWDLQHQYLDEAGLGYGPRGLFARVILQYLRTWDARSSLGVDHFIANSQFVARRIAKFYRREAEVIYPPVDTDAFVPAGDERRDGYYLAASRLVGYKRMDLIVEAFTRTPERRLVIIGEGPEKRRLERIAGPNIEFLGWQSHQALVRSMQRANAFVFAAEEDFGIVPVEAMACGTPVIAYRKGGVTESVSEGKTGVFFNAQTPESLLEAVDRFEQGEPIEDEDRLALRRSAERFSPEVFTERLTMLLKEVTGGGVPLSGVSQNKVTAQRFDNLEVAAEARIEAPEEDHSNPGEPSNGLPLRADS